MLAKKIFFSIAFTMGIVSLILSFTGLPGTYDTEPLLAIGLISLILACVVRGKK